VAIALSIEFFVSEVGFSEGRGTLKPFAIQGFRCPVSGDRYDTGTIERWNDRMLENISIIGQCSTVPLFQYSAKLEAETQNSNQIQMAEKTKFKTYLFRIGV
jgi:hypothetical protein